VVESQSLGDLGDKFRFVLEDLRPLFNSLEVLADSFAVFEFLGKLSRHFFEHEYRSCFVPGSDIITSLDDLLLDVLATFPAGFYVHEVIVSNKFGEEAS